MARHIHIHLGGTARPVYVAGKPKLLQPARAKQRDSKPCGCGCNTCHTKAPKKGT